MIYIYIWFVYKLNQNKTKQKTHHWKHAVQLSAELITRSVFIASYGSASIVDWSLGGWIRFHPSCQETTNLDYQKVDWCLRHRCGDVSMAVKQRQETKNQQAQKWDIWETSERSKKSKLPRNWIDGVATRSKAQLQMSGWDGCNGDRKSQSNGKDAGGVRRVLDRSVRKRDWLSSQIKVTHNPLTLMQKGGSNKRIYDDRLPQWIKG